MSSRDLVVKEHLTQSFALTENNQGKTSVLASRILQVTFLVKMDLESTARASALSS